MKELFYVVRDTCSIILFLCINRKGDLHRLDTNIKPTRFRFPVVRSSELKMLQKVTNLIRKGRVTSIQYTDSKRSIKAQFDGNVTEPHMIFSPANDYVFVHCTSPGPFNGAKPQNIFVSDNELDLFLLSAPPISMSMSSIAYLEASRLRGSLDEDFAKQLYMAIAEEKEDRHEVSMNEILKAIVRPFDLVGNHGDLRSIINLAVFLSIANVDPMISYKWMKNNRLQFLSIPFFKCRIYEHVSTMIHKGKIMGFSDATVNMLRLLQTKLEPLQGM